MVKKRWRYSELDRWTETHLEEHRVFERERKINRKKVRKKYIQRDNNRQEKTDKRIQVTPDRRA